MDAKELGEIRTRWAKATKGPWMAEQCGEKVSCIIVGIAFAADDEDCKTQLSGWPEMWNPETGEDMAVRTDVVCEMDGHDQHENAEAIAHAPEDVRRLLDEVAEVTKSRQRFLQMYTDTCIRAEQAEKERDEARAQAEALRADVSQAREDAARAAKAYAVIEEAARTGDGANLLDFYRTWLAQEERKSTALQAQVDGLRAEKPENP